MPRELIKSNMLEGGGGGGESFSLGKWNFETATGTPPSSNSIRLNNSTPASATKLYVHDVDDQGTNYGSKLSGLPSGSTIYVFVDDTTNFQITISAATDQSTYVEFDISDIIVEGTISNGAEVSVSVDVVGEQVDITGKADKDDTIPDGEVLKKKSGGNYEGTGENADVLKSVSNSVTDVTSLKTVPTVNLNAGTAIIFKDSGQLKVYRIKAGTDAENPPGIIRPNDYATSTNEKVWERVFNVDSFLELSEVDVSSISDGENILMLIKRVAGAPEVSDSIIKLENRTVNNTNLTNATWTNGKTTGVSGVPGQISSDANYIYNCIGTDEWERRPIVHDNAEIVTFIAAEKTESELITEYPDAIAGQWFITTSYAYQCVGDDVFRKIKTKDRYITTSSHPTLTSNLDAHDFVANGWYDDTSSGSNEATVIDDRYVDETNEVMYEKITENKWRKIS